MTEKPQDPGQINKLCLEREREISSRNSRAIRNTITVGEIENKFSELRQDIGPRLIPLSDVQNGNIMNNIEHPILLAGSVPGTAQNKRNNYTRLDELTKKFVYVYEHQDELQQTRGSHKRNALS